MPQYDVIVIGAGAAGLMAGAAAAQRGLSVLLCEKSKRPALKILVTGKGRCNVTNNCDVPGFLNHIPRGRRFMFSSANRFTPGDTMQLFSSLGVPLKTERGSRVFPESDRAGDIADALIKHAESCGCRFRYEQVTEVLTENGAVTGVRTGSGDRISCQAVIVTTGGLSYPKTGSTGDGYEIAKQTGHTITELSASLIPLITAERWVTELQGLSLKNVKLDLICVKSGKTVFSELGEMLFTHFGISGPLVLSASAHIEDLKDGYRAVIDLKPALSEEVLDKRLCRDFEKYKNRDFINSLGELLPSKMIPVMVELSGIPAEQKVNSITKEMRKGLCRLLKTLTLTVTDKRPVTEAVITRGGIELGEINPKTMESKRVDNLHFAGEVLDVDAYTGGFNLQIAFSTGFAAGNEVLGGKNL